MVYVRSFHRVFASVIATAICFGTFLLLTRCKTSDEGSLTTEDRLLRHVQFLADDRLEGRETGTPGEAEALKYVEEQFRDMGLEPAGSGGFQQAFEFTAGKSPAKETLLEINGVLLNAERDYYALAEGGEGSGKGIVHYGGDAIADVVRGAFIEPGSVTGKVLLLDLSVPGGYHPHSDFAEYADVRTKISAAIQGGASALVLFTKDENLDAPENHWLRKITESEIPVFWLTDSGYTRIYGAALPGEGSCRYALQWLRDKRTGHNALAMLDNPGTDRLVIIGAHYDHLGYGGPGSLYTGEPAIHNGADDNASGVAGLLEIARALKEDGPSGSDYLFIAFSGEELGLYGSKHFVNSGLFDSSRTAYMINLDMIGRLDSTDQKLIIDGASSSPAFAFLDSFSVNGLKIQAGGSGIGSSDHMSFYLEGIPSLHFFTGTHRDYHRPSDDIERVNFEGMASVVGVVLGLIANLDDDGKLAYVKSDEASEVVPEFKVTLGVIPDYLYEGKGMRIESVREGRPAANAGLKDGDIVVKLGDVEVLDMMSYMKALGKFEKGEESTVGFIRDGQNLSSTIVF